MPRGAADKALRWTLEGRPDLAAVRPGDEAGPVGAVAAAAGAQGQGAAPAGRRAAGPRASMRARCCCSPAACSRRWRRTSTAPRRACSTRPGSRALVAPQAGCCGAVKFHLNDQEGGKAQMRANIDAWWPDVESGQVEAIVMNASGCGVTVQGVRAPAAHDPAYADKARRISALTRDLSELLPDLVPALRGKVRPPAGLLAFHPPCTLAAWPAIARRRRDAPGANWASRAGRAERIAPVLRLGRHLLGAASRDRPRIARPQARASGATAAAGHHLGQHRLHHAPAKRHRDAGASIGSKCWTRRCRRPEALRLGRQRLFDVLGQRRRRVGRRVALDHGAVLADQELGEVPLDRRCCPECRALLSVSH